MRPAAEAVDAPAEPPVTTPPQAPGDEVDEVDAAASRALGVKRGSAALGKPIARFGRLRYRGGAMWVVVRWVLLGLWSLLVLGCNADASSSQGAGNGLGGALGFGGGSSSSAGNEPVFDVLRQRKLDSLDLLLVIDNSLSMGDKQALLAQAVPNLLERLVNPSCVVLDEPSQRVAPDAQGNCPSGYQHEFDPLDDIHIGVIDSSLGGHGGDLCTSSRSDFDPSQNDRALLLPVVRPNLSSFNGLGFLAWDPGGKYQGGEGNAEALKADLVDQILGLGEVGCDYEATLEAWYRFLIDPTPPVDIVVEDGIAGPARNSDGTIAVDPEVLAERANFLRSDSIVAIVMLTDENDCSVVDGGVGYLTTQATLDGQVFNMAAATSACDRDPNDPCCRSCGLSETDAPAGCEPLSTDPGCQGQLPPEDDALNLRCFNQKQRFGFDLLNPVPRYVDGLTQTQVYDTHNCANGSCPLVANPLFASGQRDPKMVFFAGIVGVPWQDIATQDSLLGSSLVYKTHDEMIDDGTFAVILGDPNTYTSPADPLMVETPEARAGENPVTGEPLAARDSTDPQANSINGHEYDNQTPDDLQYACIFPLREPRDCAMPQGACDCMEAELDKNRPLCNPPGGGVAGTTQYYAKAYPGLRHLQALRDFGSNAIVASICPKVTTGDLSDPNFGYNPAMGAIADKLAGALGAHCLPRSLPVDSNDLTTCRVIEVTRAGANVPSCGERPGRVPVTPDTKVEADARDYLESLAYCGQGTAIDCADFDLCEIVQLEGEARDRCLGEFDQSDNGFCYIDVDQDIGNPALVERCPDEEKRLLRFVGADGSTPVSGAITLLACY